MVRGRKKVKSNAKRNAGFVIIFIAVICFILCFVFGGIWILNVDYSSNSIEAKSSNVKSDILDSLVADELFEELYNPTLEFLTNNYSYDTKWISTCPSSQTRVGDYLYVEVCDERFKNVDDVISYLEIYLTNNLSLNLVKDNFIEYNDKLLLKPYIVIKDSTYQAFDEYKVNFITNDKISYSVVSRYNDNTCKGECNYLYKEHNFELSKLNNLWKVSKIEMPY